MSLHSHLLEIKRIFFFIILIYMTSVAGSIPQQNNKIDIYQEMSLKELMNIKVVTASDKSEELNFSPANIIVISHSQMEERGYLTLMDLMEDLPGVTWIGRYSAFNSQVIRGNFNTKRLLLMIDGMPFNPKNGFGIAWGDRFPIEGIERVEFITGPYASLYGRNTFSGVLNVITKRGKQIDGINSSVVFGSANRHQGSAVFGKHIKNTDIYLSVFKNYSSRGIDLVEEYPEYYSPEARTGETFMGDSVSFAEGVSQKVILPWDNYEIYLKLQHESGIKFQFQYNSATMPKTGAFFTSLLYTSPEDAKLTDNLLNTALSYQKHIKENLHSITSLTYQNFDWLAKNLYLDGSHKWYAQQSNSIAFNQKFHYKPLLSNKIYMGISYETVYENMLLVSSDDIPEWDDEDQRENNYFNITIQDEHSFNENLKFVAGLMYEKSNIYKDVFIPRFSFIYSGKKDVLKLIYASSFLTPGSEVTVDQISFGNNIMGRKDLDPEYINSFELNYTKCWTKKIMATLAVFRNYTDNFIQQVKDSILPAPYTHTWKNIGNSVAYGFDLSVNVRPSSTLRTFFSYSYVDGYIKDLLMEGAFTKIDRLPASALNHFKVGVNWLIFDKKLNLYIHDLYIGTRYTWEDDKINGFQFAVPDYKMEGYNLVDINIATTSRMFADWNISLGIHNLFDVKGFDPSHENYVVSSYTPIRRRWYNIRLNYSL